MYLCVCVFLLPLNPIHLSQQASWHMYLYAWPWGHQHFDVRLGCHGLSQTLMLQVKRDMDDSKNRQVVVSRRKSNGKMVETTKRRNAMVRPLSSSRQAQDLQSSAQRSTAAKNSRIATAAAAGPKASAANADRGMCTYWISSASHQPRVLLHFHQVEAHPVARSCRYATWGESANTSQHSSEQNLVVQRSLMVPYCHHKVTSDPCTAMQPCNDQLNSLDPDER